MSRLTLFALTLIPFAIACGDESSEEEEAPLPSSSGPYCEDTASPMAADDESSFGVTGGEFLAALPSDFIGVASFEGMGDSNLELRITVDEDSLRFVESVAVYPETDGPVPAIDVMCGDRIEIDVRMELHTEDGQLAETIDTTMSMVDHEVMMTEPGAISAWIELEADAINGSLDMGDYLNPDEFDSATFYVDAMIVDSELVGNISALGEVVTSEGEDGTAMAAIFPVAELEGFAPAYAE